MQNQEIGQIVVRTEWGHFAQKKSKFSNRLFNNFHIFNNNLRDKQLVY